MNSAAKIASLEAENASLRQQMQALEEKVVFLLKIIEQQKVKKDSHNSHNPPSQDKSKPRRNGKSLRPKSTRKPDGQKGHKGFTLFQKPNPDETHILQSNYCTICGEDLSEQTHDFVSKR